MSLLEVSGLHVWFDPPSAAEVHAVQGVSFALDAGERFGLVGESGCGKTTTILALMGLLPPNASAAGEVLLDGQNILAGGEESVQAYRWKDIAMVFQGAMNALNPVKKIGWQIAEPMAYHGVAQGAAARQRAGELLEMVGIPAAAGERYPHEFSGGMRQRAAIAMALACEPKILLADEPTTALDVMVQAQILELLTRLLFAATPDLYGHDAVISIPGAPPRLDVAGAGCPFRPRCDVPLPRCVDEHPELRLVEPAHLAACHRNELVGAS